jgi:hypothetical protein
MSRTISLQRDKSEENAEIAGLEGHFGWGILKRLQRKSDLSDEKAVRPSLR